MSDPRDRDPFGEGPFEDDPQARDPFERDREQEDPFAPDAFGSDPFDSYGYETEEPYRRPRLMRTVALLLVVAMAVTYAGFEIMAAFRSTRPITTQQGLADERGFKFLNIDPGSGEPVRYDPCTPISYVVNAQHAPRGGVDDVHGAVQRTAEATGIRFVYEGEVNEVPRMQRHPYQPDRYGDRWAPILIGWIPQDSDIFEVDGVGVAGSAIQRNPAGRLVYVGGTVVLNGTEHLANGFSPGKTWGKVVLHELGHVLGLDHVEDPGQVMFDTLTSSPANWGLGDRAGLAQLGRPAGCLDNPSPGN